MAIKEFDDVQKETDRTVVPDIRPNQTYVDIYDELLCQAVTELNLRDELKRQLLSLLGNSSIFQFQRLNQLEEVANEKYRDSQYEHQIEVIQLFDPSKDADVRKKNRELIQGRYSFKFPKSIVTQSAKLDLIASEPTAYYLYKKGDLSTKIDKLATDKIKLANLIFKVSMDATEGRQARIAARFQEFQKEIMGKAKNVISLENNSAKKKVLENLYDASNEMIKTAKNDLKDSQRRMKEVDKQMTTMNSEESKRSHRVRFEDQIALQGSSRRSGRKGLKGRDKQSKEKEMLQGQIKAIQSVESVRHDIKLILQMAITKMLDEALTVSEADRLE